MPNLFFDCFSNYDYVVILNFNAIFVISIKMPNLFFDCFSNYDYVVILNFNAIFVISIKMPNLTSFKRTPVQIAERAQNTGCDLQCRKMFFKSEFSKTERAQKTLVQITNEGHRTGAVRISTAFLLLLSMKCASIV